MLITIPTGEVEDGKMKKETTKTFEEIQNTLKQERYITERYYRGASIFVRPGPPKSYTIHLANIDFLGEKAMVEIALDLEDIGQIIETAKLITFCEHRKIPYRTDCRKKDVKKIKQWGFRLKKIASKLEEKLK